MAGGRVRIDVEIQGHRELVRLQLAEELLAGPWKTAMDEVGDMAVTAWKGASPVGPSGQMRARMTSKVQARPIPKWVLVKSTATRSSRRYKRYRYPRRIEYDPRSPHRLKLTRALKQVMGRVQGVLDNAARKIEATWRA